MPRPSLLLVLRATIDRLQRNWSGRVRVTAVHWCALRYLAREPFSRLSDLIRDGRATGALAAPETKLGRPVCLGVSDERRMKIAVQWRTFVSTAALFYLVAAAASTEKFLSSGNKSRSQVNEFNPGASGERLGQRSHRAASDICSYYGNRLLTTPQSARGQTHNRDVPAAGIWVTHDLFDAAFGLTPHLTYKGSNVFHFALSITRTS